MKMRLPQNGADAIFYRLDKAHSAAAYFKSYQSNSAICQRTLSAYQMKKSLSCIRSRASTIK